MGGAVYILAADPTPRLVLDLLIVLTTAGIVALVMSRAKLSAIPAYIIAGAIIGPDALGIASSDSLEGLARLATVMLLFGIGLQLHLSAIQAALGRYIAAGFGSGAVTTLIGWPIGMALGLPGPAALVAAMGLSLSSTVVIMQHLALRREVNRSHGRLALAILVVQDLVVLGMLASIPVLAAFASADADPGETMSVGETLRFLIESAARLAGLALVVVVTRWLLPRVLAEATRGRGTDVLLVVATAAAIGAAVATQALGFSAELGAFLAGLTLAASPARHQISGQIGPLRDLFVAVFFTTIGMRLAPGVLVDHLHIVLIGLVLLLVIKGVVIGLTSWAIGAGGVTAALVGFMLAEAGEFSLLLFSTAEIAGVLTQTQFRVLVTITAVSLMLTPALAWAGRRVAPRFRGAPLPPWLSRGLVHEGATAEEDPAAGAARGRYVIIGGFGPVGRAVAEALGPTGATYTVVELNTATVHSVRAEGRKAIYGDVSNSHVLESAGIEHADALVLTIPDEDVILRAAQAAREAHPGVLIVARATFASQAALARTLGADLVVVDEIAAAKAMRDRVINRLIAGDTPAPTHPGA